MNKTVLGMASGLGAASIWGGMFVVSKATLEVIPPFVLISMRLVLGAGTLGIVLALRGWRPVRRHDVLRTLAVGLVGYGISLGFQFVGTRYSTAANAALVTSATPAFILVFAALLLREGISMWNMIALLVSTAGVLAIVDPFGAQPGSPLLWGNLSLVAAALTWALYSVLVRKVTRSLDALSFTSIALLGGIPLALPLGMWELAHEGTGVITGGVIAGVLFLGIVSTAVAMYLWTTAFAQMKASQASLTFFAQPLVGTALGVLFLGEVLSPMFFVGAVLIGIGLVLASRSN